MAFSRLLSSSVYSERCDAAGCRCDWRTVTQAPALGTWHRNGVPLGSRAAPGSHQHAPPQKLQGPLATKGHVPNVSIHHYEKTGSLQAYISSHSWGPECNSQLHSITVTKHPSGTNLCPQEEGYREGKDREFGMNMYTRCYVLKWITN